MTLVGLDALALLLHFQTDAVEVGGRRLDGGFFVGGDAGAGLRRRLRVPRGGLGDRDAARLQLAT